MVLSAGSSIGRAPERLPASDHSPHLLCMISAEDMTFLRVGEQFCRVVGYSRQELLGMSAAVMLRPGEDTRADLPEVYRQFDEVRQGLRERAIINGWIRRRDGRRVDLETAVHWDAPHRAWVMDSAVIAQEGPPRRATHHGPLVYANREELLRDLYTVFDEHGDWHEFTTQRVCDQMPQHISPNTLRARLREFGLLYGSSVAATLRQMAAERLRQRGLL